MSRFRESNNSAMTFTAPDFTIADSRYFKLDELRCKGRNCCGQSLKVNVRLLELLDAIRERFDAPLFVNSGYRCPRRNQQVGGSRDSQHMRGNAADIRPGVNSLRRFPELVGICGELNPPGMGVYSNGARSFVHVDCRPLAAGATLARWGEWNDEPVAYELALSQALVQAV